MNIQSFSSHFDPDAVRAPAPGRPVVATDVIAEQGVPVRCAAAPIVLGALRGLGFDARLGPLPTTRDDLSELLVASSSVRGRVVAVGVYPADRAAMAAAGRLLCQVVEASRPRRVLLPSPRSFCAGVERAIQIVEEVLRRHGPSVYVRNRSSTTHTWCDGSRSGVRSSSTSWTACHRERR